MIPALPPAPAVLDRRCEERNAPGFLDNIRGNAAHKVLVMAQGKALLDGDGLIFLDPAELTEPPVLAVYLGAVEAHGVLAAGTDVVLQVFADDAGDSSWVPDGAVFRGYRDAAAGLSEADAAIFIQAQAVANWHQSHPRCPRCGAETEIMSAGWMRRCPVDGSEHFPRTDPAVIVAIVGADDRLLLANNFAWDDNRYSTVAGFAEAGESAEQAAVREIFEEVGVHLHTTHYVGSQAWPFPRSLMLGFVGYTNSTVATPDLTEVRGARWFSREELQAEVQAGTTVISNRMSIARALIEHWYGGRILEQGE